VLTPLAPDLALKSRKIMSGAAAQEFELPLNFKRNVVERDR
jgi:hypothetical protein